MDNQEIIEYINIQEILISKISERDKLNIEIHDLADRKDKLRQMFIEQRNQLSTIVKYKKEFYIIDISEDEYSDDGYCLNISKESMQDLDND